LVCLFKKVNHAIALIDKYALRITLVGLWAGERISIVQSGAIAQTNIAKGLNVGIAQCPIWIKRAFEKVERA
jgi:hypothetical protein